MNQTDYWKANVKSKEAARLFFSLYYPQYPEQLCDAIATRIDNLLQKARSGDELTDAEAKYFKNPTQETSWDYKEELKQQETVGKIHQAMERLTTLANE